MLDTWFSSALWPFATLGWPDDTDDLRSVLPRRPEHDRARDHPPLGEPDDLLRARADGRHPVPDVIIHSTVLAPTGGGCRRASARASTRSRHRRARRGRDALRAAEDVLDAGRALLARARSRRGASSRTSSGTRAGCCCPHARRRAATSGRASLEERWILARLDAAQRRDRGGPRRVRLLRTSSTSSTTSPSTTSATGTPRRSSRGSTASDADAQATALAALERLLKLLHPVDAARDRGDLDEPARRASRG